MNEKLKKPPKIASIILKKILPRGDSEFLYNDFKMIYSEKVISSGKFKAWVWFWGQVFKTAPGFLFHTLNWSATMFKNYLKIALRNIRKYKTYSFINISGLSIGMACCILILLFVKDELSYDNFQENGQRIYRILSHSTLGGTTRKFASSPPALGTELPKSIPEIISAVRIYGPYRTRIRYQDNEFEIENTLAADSTFFNIFSYEFIAGNKNNCLMEPNTVVITEEIAVRIFGNENPLGKVIVIPSNRQGIEDSEMRVTGVIKDVPKNTNIPFKAVRPISSITYNSPPARRYFNDPIYFSAHTYVLLGKDVNFKKVEEKIMNIVENKWGSLLKQRGITRYYPLQKLNDVHLKPGYEMERGNPGNINYVYLFSAIALFVLFIACFNFINLSTARSSRRSREIGLRKVCGAYRGQLIKQFLNESILLSFFGLFSGVLIVILTLPFFNTLTGKEFNFTCLLDKTTIFCFLGIIIFSGIFAGSLPAFILSSFHPINILKGRLALKSSTGYLRTMMVILQFSISIFMIACTIIILKQLGFIKNKTLGFNKDQVLVITSFGGRINDALKNELLKNQNIRSITFSNHVPGRFTPDLTFYPEGRSNEETLRASGFFVDFDFIKTYEMEIIEGRDFNKRFISDTTHAVILNETAAEQSGIGLNCIGKSINIAANYYIPENSLNRVIIGIVKDFHHKNLRHMVNPTLIFVNPRIFGYVSVRIKPDNFNETLQFLEKTCKRYYPDREFTHFFIDDEFRNMYESEERVKRIYSYFAILAIIIACLGLYGLASFVVDQRIKEIGIRKVLGASVYNIINIISKKFAIMVLISNIFAWPFVWYIMNRWLRDFAYRINIHVTTLIISGLIALLIACLTVGFQSLLAAVKNPVESLRVE